MFNDMNRLARGVLITTLATVLLLVVGSIAGNFYLGVRLASAQNERAQVSQALDTVQEEYNGLYREYTDATGGEPDAATPSQVNDTVDQAPAKNGEQGVQGIQGPRGLMGEPGQTGPQGEPGKDGAAGTKGADGVNGKDGSTGKDGAKGSDGAVGPAGPAGPGGSTGPQGPQGVPGFDGMNGRGISNMTCGSDGSWVVTYTDGTVETISGPCRVLTEIPIPTPSQ